MVNIVLLSNPWFSYDFWAGKLHIARTGHAPINSIIIFYVTCLLLRCQIQSDKTEYICDIFSFSGFTNERIKN